MKKQTCKKTRLIIDSKINKSSAKNSFETLCLIDSIKALTEVDWLSLSDFDQWSLQDSLSCIVYKC